MGQEGRKSNSGKKSLLKQRDVEMREKGRGEGDRKGRAEWREREEGTGREDDRKVEGEKERESEC